MKTSSSLRTIAHHRAPSCTVNHRFAEHIAIKTMGNQSDRIAAVLADRAGSGAGSAHVTDAIVDTCRGIDAALTPVIGTRGVAALWQRSLHASARSHAWLARAAEGSQTGIDLAPLRSVFEQQSDAHAAAAGGELLQTFYELMTSLVGESLTERLLRTAWAPFLSASTSADPSP